MWNWPQSLFLEQEKGNSYGTLIGTEDASNRDESILCGATGSHLNKFYKRALYIAFGKQASYSFEESGVISQLNHMRDVCDVP